MTNRDASSNKTLTIPQELQQSSVSPPFSPLDSFERYTIIREQGAGGIGRVFVAFDSIVEREIALKELKTSAKKECNTIPPLDAAPSASEIRFVREAKVTGQLEHPSIVPVYEIGTKHNNTPFYTMRLVQGETLSVAISRATTIEKRLRLLPHFRDICNAVAYAHSRGVVHRDIKPENIMIGKFGETVVLDWGLAKVAGEKDDTVVEMNLKEHSHLKTLSGKAMGTPAYMSPEQAKGNITEIDEKSDIYALGAVLYEILTGTPPFGGGDAQKVIDRVIAESPVAVESLEPLMPPELCAIVNHTLAKKKKDRYASSQEVANEIESYMSGERVAIYDYTSRELLQRFFQRNSYLAGAIITILLILITASFISFNLYRETLNKEKKAHLNLSLGYQEYAQRLIFEQRWDNAAIFAAAALYHSPYSPDSPWEFTTILSEKERRTHLINSVSNWFVASRSRVNALQQSVAIPSGDVYSVAIINSSLIALGGENKVISLVNIENESKKIQLRGHKDRITTINYDKKKELLVSSSLDGSVRLWDMRKNGELYGVNAGSKELFAVDFNPAKEVVAYGGADKIVTLWNYRTGTTKVIAPGHFSIIRAVAWNKKGEMLASSDQNGFIMLFDGTKVTHLFRGHSEAAVALDFSPDGKVLVSAGYDKEIHGWDVKTGRRLFSFRYRDAFYAVKFSPDGHSVVATSRDGTVQFFNLETTRREEIRTHFGSVRSFAFADAGKTIVTAGDGNHIEIWNTTFSRETRVYRGHSTYIPSIALSSKGALLATSGWDRTVQLWDAATESVLFRLPQQRAVAHSILFSHDDTQVIVADMDGWIRVYDTRSGSLLIEKQAHTTAINKLVLSPDGRVVATAGKDGTVRLWDFRTLKMTGLFQKHAHSVQAAAFSPDGKKIASADRDGAILLWNVNNLHVVKQLPPLGSPLKDIAWSSTGVLALLDESDSVRIWDSTQERFGKTIVGPEASKQLLFSSDGKLLALIGKDSYVYEMVPQLPYLKIRHLLQGYAGAFSADGAFFAVSSGAVVKRYPLSDSIWHENSKKLLEESQKAAQLELSGFKLKAR